MWRVLLISEGKTLATDEKSFAFAIPLHEGIAISRAVIMLAFVRQESVYCFCFDVSIA